MELSQVDPLLSDEEEYDVYVNKQDVEDGCTLVDAVDMKKVDSGTLFSLKLNEEAAMEEQNMMYDDENVFDHINLECLGCEEEDDNVSGQTPFAKIAEKMVDLVPGGKVRKRILQQGYGEVVPPKALVIFHHNSYTEFSETPFDSSYLRELPVKRRLQGGEMIQGLDIGLATMKAGEKAQFLIAYDYAYGKLGVPPRIPPESDILIHVEMIKFIDNELAIKLGEASHEELEQKTFAEVYSAAKSLSAEGNTSFGLRRHEEAVRYYKKALDLLEKCSKQSDEDEDKFVELAVKVSCNLAVCYNILKQHQKAIRFSRNAIRYKNTHAKGYYLLAVAQLNLGSHDDAKANAFQARRYAPNSREVTQLLEKIDKNLQLYKEESVSFAKKMFQFSNTKENEDSNSSKSVQEKDDEDDDEHVNCSKSFQLNVIEYINEFIADPKKDKIYFPNGLTYDEEKFIRQQAKNYKLLGKMENVNGNCSFFLTKP